MAAEDKLNQSMDLQYSYFTQAATKTIGLVCLLSRWLLSEPPRELNTDVGCCNVTKVEGTEKDIAGKERLEAMLKRLKKEELVGTRLLL